MWALVALTVAFYVVLPILIWRTGRKPMPPAHTYVLTNLQPEDRAIFELWQGGTLPDGPDPEIIIPTEQEGSWRQLLRVMNITRE